MANQPAKEWLVCRVKNVKNGITTNGNPWRSFGLKVEEGPRKGQWVNFFRVVTEGTLPYYKKDCAAMGVTNDTVEGFECDGRLVTVKWGEETYKGKTEDKVLGVLPYKARDSKPDQDPNNGEELLF